MKNQINQLNLPTVNNYTLIDNVFLGAIKNLSLNAYKLFALMAAQIKRSDEHFTEYEIKVDDLVKVLNLSNKKYIYEVLKDATNELHDIKVVVDSDDIRTQYPWLTKSSYLKNEGTAILRFHEDLKPFLLRLNTRYSKVWLSQTFAFSSHNTRNMYLYLCENRNRKSFKTKLSFLKQKLSIETTAYSRYLDFRRRVLDPTYKEIHEKTLLRYDFEPVKTGRRITDIQFNIYTVHIDTKKQKLPTLEEVSEKTKLKEEYYLQKEKHILHLINESTEEDVIEFKKEVDSDQLEFSFENEKPKDLPYRYFLLRKTPFQSYEDWLVKKDNITIDVEYVDMDDNKEITAKNRLQALGWTGSYSELTKEVVPEAIEAYYDNLVSMIGKIDREKVSKQMIHEYIDQTLKTQVMPYYQIYKTVLSEPKIK
jgi:plasmid replication initiation protein